MTYREQLTPVPATGTQVRKDAARSASSSSSDEIPLNWNKWFRQIHRWLSIAFILGVIVNGIAVVQGKYAAWMGLLSGLPLLLLLLTGLYLFMLPYVNKWRVVRRTV